MGEAHAPQAPPGLGRREPYRELLEDALRRYTRALDFFQWEAAFLGLWGLLETLTGTRPQDSHDLTVRRASFLYADPEREVHVQTLNHLRHYRNRSVHGGESSATIEAYLYQLKRYVEQLLLFHLTNSYGFRSFERAAAFLSLPPGPADLRRMDENRRRESEEARAAAVEAPTLALAGGESFQFMRDAARKLAEAMPDARARLLEGQTHAVAPEALAPVLGEFFGDRA